MIEQNEEVVDETTNDVTEEVTSEEIQEIDEDFIVIVEDTTNIDLITDLSTIDCFYHIYGTRKDGEVLIPEYKGETPEDYPGNNNQYSIAGYHYDRRTL